jgi:hypothetical protein
VQTTLKASCTGHKRKGMIDLLDVLEFRSTNIVHQPVIETPSRRCVINCAVTGIIAGCKIIASANGCAIPVPAPR